MAEYLIQDVTLMNIANVIKAKTGKQDVISVSDFASEIGTIQAFEAELPVLDAAYPKDVNLTVIKGDTVSATFNVVFTAHGKPAEYDYQWYVDGVAVEGANNSVFVKDNLANTANHSIYCEITNEAGTVATRVATLKVTQYYTPVLNASYPADVTLNDGSTTSATFKVQIDTSGNPAEHTYQWYVDGAAVEGATGTTYTMSNLIKAVTHTVYCKVTNAAGTVQSRTATLVVKHTLLYNAGTRYDAVTGGFAAVGKKRSSDSSSGTAAPGIAYNASNFKITQSASSAGIVYTKNKIDVSNHKTLHVKAQFYFKNGSNNWHHGVRVWSSIGTYANDNAAASWGPATGTHTQTQDVSINVSSVNGSHYIGFFIQSAGTVGDYYTVVTKMWLEG